MLKAHFVTLARYNKWANARLYRMACALPEEAYRRNVGAYFGSLHGTLNHLLTADRIWMRRLTGSGDHPTELNAIVCADLQSLRTARETQDERIVSFVETLEEAQLERQCDYRTLNGAPQKQPVGEILAHLFNHQTHHRGQAHTILSVLGVEPDSLDLLIMLRTRDVVS